MIGEIDLVRSTFKAVLTIFRILFWKKPFQHVLFLPHHFNCSVITPSDYTVNFQKVLMSITICLKHFLEKRGVLVNLIFDTQWFNLLFWHMSYLHWRENQTSIQDFPYELRTWGLGEWALQNLIGVLKPIHVGGGHGGLPRKGNICC